MVLSVSFFMSSLYEGIVKKSAFIFTPGGGELKFQLAITHLLAGQGWGGRWGRM